MWKCSGCTYGPFERLPILPRANEQGKHNEVCLVVLWAEQVGEREGKLGVYKCSSLARESQMPVPPELLVILPLKKDLIGHLEHPGRQRYDLHPL